MSTGIVCKCHASSASECGCNDVDWRLAREVELEAENKRLREQVAHLSLFKPARRTEQQEPVKAIGPTNWSFYGMADDHFVDASKMVAD